MSSGLIVYDEKLPMAYVRGIAVPLGRKPVSASDILATFQNVLALDYEGEDESLKGLNKFDAGMTELGRRVEKGDLEAIKFVVEHTKGKPIQQVNNFNVNADLKDFLSQLVKKRQETAPPAVDPFGD